MPFGESQLWGDAVWGDAVWGDAVWGDAVLGDAVWGDAVWGEISSGEIPLTRCRRRLQGSSAVLTSRGYRSLSRRPSLKIERAAQRRRRGDDEAHSMTKLIG